MSKRPYHNFSPQDDHVWKLLYERVEPIVRQHAHPLYLEGLKTLDLPSDRVPDFYKLNEQIMDLVGWELVSTDVQYSDGQTWFEHLAEKKFLITEYIREEESLDYTPLPDIWHDSFGHLPFMVHQDYADYMQEYGKRAIEFPKAIREKHGLGSLWWYSIEFGVMHHEGTLKAFGAGLISGYTEFVRAFDGDTELIEYTIENVSAVKPSPHVIHDKLFLIKSFEQLHDVLDQWCTATRELYPQ